LKDASHISNLFFSFAVLTFFLFLPLLAFAGQFKVSRVYDGDTIQVIENEKEIIIHLVGIDAPELSHRKHLPGQPFCIKSKEYLSSLILNKVVHIKFFGKDGSEKLLGEIFTDQKNINIEMINKFMQLRFQQSSQLMNGPGHTLRSSLLTQNV